MNTHTDRLADGHTFPKRPFRCFDISSRDDFKSLFFSDFIHGSIKSLSNTQRCYLWGFTAAATKDWSRIFVIWSNFSTSRWHLQRKLKKVQTSLGNFILVRFFRRQVIKGWYSKLNSGQMHQNRRWFDCESEILRSKRTESSRQPHAACFY